MLCCILIHHSKVLYKSILLQYSVSDYNLKIGLWAGLQWVPPLKCSKTKCFIDQLGINFQFCKKRRQILSNSDFSADKPPLHLQSCKPQLPVQCTDYFCTYMRRGRSQLFCICVFVFVYLRICGLVQIADRGVNARGWRLHWRQGRLN